MSKEQLYQLASELLQSLEFDKINLFEGYCIEFKDEPYDSTLLDLLKVDNSNAMVLLARLYYQCRYPSGICHCVQIESLLENAISLKNLYATYYLAEFYQYNCISCPRRNKIDTSITLFSSLENTPLAVYTYAPLVYLYQYKKPDPEKVQFYTRKYFKSGLPIENTINKDELIKYLVAKLQKKKDQCAQLKAKVLKYKYQPGGTKSQELQSHFHSLCPEN